MKRRALGFVVLPILAACSAPLQSNDPTNTQSLSSCGADVVQDLVGQPLEQHRGRLPASARIIPPNAAVTQDYSLERMNVNLNESGAVLRIWCG